MNTRFTPETNHNQEDIIGDVIMGRDLNNFIHQRLEQHQQQNNRPIPPQQPINQDPGNYINSQNMAGNPGVYVNDNGLYIGNQVSKVASNFTNDVQMKTIKIRFEIDFQINLNVNGG